VYLLVIKLFALHSNSVYFVISNILVYNDSIDIRTALRYFKVKLKVNAATAPVLKSTKSVGYYIAKIIASKGK